MDKFEKALKVAFAFEGYNEKDVGQIVRKALNVTSNQGVHYFKDTATNCFNSVSEIEMFKTNIETSSLVENIEVDGDSLKILTNIYLQKADKKLELNLVKVGEKWYLVDKGSIHKVLEEKYFAVDEGRYTRTAYFIGLKNRDFNLSKDVSYSSISDGIGRFKSFVDSITKPVK